MKTDELVAHFFRHEYGRLVAVLSNRVGVQYLETVEDAAQAALMSALEVWPVRGRPDNPSAWLYRVAHNRLMGELRKRSGQRQLLSLEAAAVSDSHEDRPECHSPGEVNDELLRMLFVCCDDVIPIESQLVLALKTLCGFSTREIALRLFTTEANIYKRLARARQRLQQDPDHFGQVAVEQYPSRVSSVHKVLYLLFTEGYLSSHAEFAIRRELCEEAVRLTDILANHPAGRTPETYALLAMMHLHSARMSARQSASGGLLLLEEQDRARWDQDEIRIGLGWLARSAEGDNFSRYHAEAGIAAEHCLAPSLEETRWERVVSCYALLEQTTPSPLHTLNRAVAIAEWKGPAMGLAVLDGLEPPSWLAGSYLWMAVLADLNRRCGNCDTARRYRDQAFETAPTGAIRELLQRRLQAIDAGVNEKKH